MYESSIPDIWNCSVCTVSWFAVQERPELTHCVTRKPSSSTSSSVTLKNSKRTKCVWDDEVKDDEESGTGRPRTAYLSLAIAPWAKPFQSKRGVVRPFATRSQVLAANPNVPPVPPKSYPTPIAARYLEVSRRSMTESADRGQSTLSQWVRADITEGKNVHTMPPITPR